MTRSPKPIDLTPILEGGLAAYWIQLLLDLNGKCRPYSIPKRDSGYFTRISEITAGRRMVIRLYFVNHDAFDSRVKPKLHYIATRVLYDPQGQTAGNGESGKRLRKKDDDTAAVELYADRDVSHILDIDPNNAEDMFELKRLPIAYRVDKDSPPFPNSLW
ncbi:hypothetical protein BJ085DRAFT_29046 [Dimargaris cristalligena]|uniref:Uncharacterized protein n=1 Tax=Dimargaris cristalligena TaxID=215637 RepID=A0A4P9ZZ56_9FUNG|nr:hypothetical protein BJ085DRAFT_29046 [Dimargaris cristalligena]|eukprot:RKP38361.1 hypothetical protein BJ085DRAFT_29046 [Dimargaris cristalligena]